MVNSLLFLLSCGVSLKIFSCAQRYTFLQLLEFLRKTLQAHILDQKESGQWALGTKLILTLDTPAFLFEMHPVQV